MRRIFALCFSSALFLQAASGQDGKGKTLQSEPVATLLLSAAPASQAEASWTSVVFTSETSIAVGVCLRNYISQKCSLILARWEDGKLHSLAQTPRFDPTTSIYPASEGRVLAVEDLSPASLYSKDLSTVQDLPMRFSRFISPSGRTLAEWAQGSWKLYQLTDGLEPVREGAGDLQDISDEAVLIQDHKVMRVETLDGQPLGSFSAPPDYYASAKLLGKDKLYLDDCKSIRIADFQGRKLLRMNAVKGCMGDTKSSADGRRILFDYTDRKITGLKHILENVQTATTLGMIGPEDVNREQVRVFDTTTGEECFHWQRSFPMTYARVKSAAISSSGEFVAIVTKDMLSLYRLPASCNDSKALTPNR